MWMGISCSTLESEEVRMEWVSCAYAPQAGLDEEIKRRFWEELDEVVRSIPPFERLFIGGDFNDHIGLSAGGYTEVNGDFGFGEQNEGGTSLLDLAKAFDLVIANSCFPKREEHLVTYQSSVAKTQIDYLIRRRCDRRLCEDCKVILGETLATQHRLLVMDIGIRIKRKKRSIRGRPRIRWDALTKDKAQDLEGRLSTMGAWRSSGDTNTMWSTTTNCIRKEVREVLGTSSGRTGGHKGDWWWNVVVQGKVEAKKTTYLWLIGSTDEEEKRANNDRYKVARNEAKMAVTEAKTAAFARLYEELGNKGREKKLFRIAKVRERTARDLDQVRCIKDDDNKVLMGDDQIKRRWQTYFHKLLNKEGDQDFLLGELRNVDSPYELSYCRDIEVDEVMEAMQKAYDRVPREVLWSFLEVKGVPAAYIKVIKDMNDGAKTRVRTVRGNSEHFSVVTGLHQGSAFSPFLFALVMYALTHHIQGDVPWCMLFADDIVLIDETRGGVCRRPPFS
ncbi:uncharacterized protein [Nicotiana sylvestris]|uniref:uncharacterized protein n=1 Tax=Nicotiana sylvestris TaxID=4096 RepID=UPI00388C3403